MSTAFKALGLDRLSSEERLQLAEELWSSLVAEPESIAVTEEQRADLQRRLESYHDDPQAGSPWDEVKARLKGSE